MGRHHRPFHIPLPHSLPKHKQTPRQFLSHWSPNFRLWTHETKLSTTSVLKPYGKKTSFSFSSSNHQHQINNKHSTYQPGGTMMVVKNNDTSAISLHSQCPNLHKGQHVCSHHENTPNKTPTTWQEHLNLKADSVPKHSTSPILAPRMFPHCQVYMKSGEDIISSNEIFTSQWK
jgi:hypothetical protein